MKKQMKSFFIVVTLMITTSVFASEKTNGLKFGDPLPANAFIELARVINPAVVNISTKTVPKQRFPRGYRDPFFDMLEQMYGLRMQPQLPNARPQMSLGTGFIIREDGLIVTNNHVIAGADEIEVQLIEKSDKFYQAKVIGSDDRTDIALIKIEGKNLPTVQLGSSSDTQVGEWVAAFGNPYGNGHTMTKGIISAKGRDINEINKFPLLQTDAPINPGNSGGPLVNLKGQVVGVNSAIDARAQGIGFAIPIDEVKAILPQLEKLGKIKKGYLGVGLADLDPQAAMALGLKDTEGAVIAQVEKNGPAAKAGILTYDVITEFNSKKIKNSSELRDAVADASIGSSIPLKVIREGKTKSLQVVVSERPDSSTPKKQRDQKKFTGTKAPHDLGFTVVDPNPVVRKEFDLEDDVTKPVVVEVERGPAALAGLMAGDVILDINRKEVSTASDVTKGLKKGTNTLRVARQGSIVFIMIEVR
ncbi:MAG: serine protease MucD [Oligoflexia bacterium]|nr:MAG: serine protease MucD [Oligoflexia bacterium]